MTAERLELQTGLSVEIYATPQDAVVRAGDELADLLKSVSYPVVGLATGSTPELFYEELVRRHQSGLSFRGMSGFNLDEYEGVEAGDPMSFRSFMESRLYDHINARQANFLPGTSTPDEAEDVCAAYEHAIEQAGGLDWQLLGIGGNGHIAFNEPGSDMESRTRRVELDARTRSDAAKAFGGLDKVPVAALTMGIGTILEARRIVMMAWGKGKAGIVAKALQGEVTAEVPASFLQEHRNVLVLLDEAAASELKFG
ncbi:MAG: glucosamine-6-phosphate deaminase [Verrucomicrobiota bacterium JB023]|nr:glucosamine-6-phosphate deaminase [Verrucomicrobiota bacterium JB023]